jgi:D-alanyl-D-alanine dipeptidase
MKNIFSILLAITFISCSDNPKSTEAEHNSQAKNAISMRSFSQTFHTKQVLLVTSIDEQAIQGKIRLLQWDEAAQKWQQELGETPVTLGRTGLAWAKGHHPASWNNGIMKKEGDGKSPQGIFAVTSFFGYKPEKEVGFVSQLPYKMCGKNDVCVDDVNSSSYNRLNVKNGVIMDWKSAEDMLRTDSQYALGAMLDYNSNPVVKGEGSCVFIHIWRAADKPTAGCTALPANEILPFFAKLSAAQNPLLVQMTEANMRKYLGDYDLTQ